MNFEESEITRQVAQTARDFAQQQIRPHFMIWDESQDFPRQLFRDMGQLGLMGVLVPEQYGGSGLSYFEYKAVIEEIAKVCGSIGLSLAAHNSLCTGHILQFGNEAQKKNIYPCWPVVNGWGHGDLQRPIQAAMPAICVARQLKKEMNG